MFLGILAGFLRILPMNGLHGENLFWVIFAKIHQLRAEFEVFSWKVRLLGFGSRQILFWPGFSLIVETPESFQLLM